MTENVSSNKLIKAFQGLHKNDNNDIYRDLQHNPEAEATLGTIKDSFQYYSQPEMKELTRDTIRLTEQMSRNVHLSHVMKNHPDFIHSLVSHATFEPSK